ncbi:MAG: diacylglycerol kinase family protein [Treponemataceae bacterium]
MIRHLRAAAFRLGLKLLADGRSEDSKPGKNKNFARSMKNALRGLLLTFATERNFRFECLAAIVVTVAGIAYGIDRVEWAIVTTNIFLVLALEAKNTATELTIDIATQDYDYDAKSSKDASSGAVLLAAFSSIATAAFIFAPRFWESGLSLFDYVFVR